MRNDTTGYRQAICMLIIVVAILMFAWQAQAGSIPNGGSTYEISWSVIDSGGGQGSGDSYTVTSSLGQVATNSSTAGTLKVESGYIVGLKPARYGVYLPVIASE